MNLLKIIVHLKWMNHIIYKIYLSKVRGGDVEGVTGRRERHRDR